MWIKKSCFFSNISLPLKTNGKWSHSVPKCLAPCIVPHIEMGQAANLSTGSTVRHDESVTIVCNGNFELAASNSSAAGGSSVQCNNGTWTTIPRCRKDGRMTEYCFTILL